MSEVLLSPKDRERETYKVRTKAEVYQAFAALEKAAYSGDASGLDEETLIILQGAVREMNRHLPDFFED